MPTPNATLLIDGNRGIYIPNQFARVYAEQYLVNKEELKEELDDLLDTNSEHYWESWATVLDNAKLINDNNVEQVLYQNCDLWAVPINEQHLIPEQ